MRVSLFFAAVVAVGCGSVSAQKTDAGGDGPPAGDFTLSVAPDSVNIPIASSMNVTVTVQRSNGIGDITLAANGLPTGITVTFATNPLPAGTDTTDATIAVAGGTAAGTSMVTILGTAGTKEHSATVSVTAQTITVAGTVAGNLANITVGLVGKSSVTSDSTGHFTFTDVTPPYDLYTYRVASILNNPVPSIVYYDKLTRPDPVIRAASDVFFQLILLRKFGTFSGTKSGTGGTGDPSRPSILLWSNGSTGGALNAGANTYTMLSASWGGLSTTNAGTVYGLQWSLRTNGAPNTILGYGTTDTTLTASADTAVNINFAAPPAAGLVGSITPPAGYANPPTLTLQQQLGFNRTVLWTGNTTDATATIPVIAAGKSSLHAIAQTGSGNTLESSTVVFPGLNSATDVTFALPAPATQVTPLNAATNVATTTPFQVDAPMGLIYVHRMTSTGSTAADYQIISTSATLTIPNVSELPLPSNQPFNWRVTGYGPFASVDACATDTGFIDVGNPEFAGTKHFQTNSQLRTFTSKP